MTVITNAANASVFEFVKDQCAFCEDDLVYFKSRNPVAQLVGQGYQEIPTAARWGMEGMFGTERYHTVIVPGYGKHYREYLSRLL